MPLKIQFDFTLFMFIAIGLYILHVCFWLKLVCDGVVYAVEWLLLKSCCVELCGIMFVMYGSSVLASVLTIAERTEMGVYDVEFVHVFVRF